MARYIGPVCRLCRREGMKLFLKGERCYTEKCAIEKRNVPPGQHGRSRRAKVAGYGIQPINPAKLEWVPIRMIARPFMQELSDFAGASVSLGSRDRLNMVYIEHCRPDTPITRHSGSTTAPGSSARPIRQVPQGW